MPEQKNVARLDRSDDVPAQNSTSNGSGTISSADAWYLRPSARNHRAGEVSASVLHCYLAVIRFQLDDVSACCKVSVLGTKCREGYKWFDGFYLHAEMCHHIPGTTVTFKAAHIFFLYFIWH